MEKRFKLRLSRLFRSSFSSCSSRNISDVIEKAVFIPQDHQPTRPVSPKTRSFPSICRLDFPETTTQNINISFPRRRLSETYSTSNPFHEFRDCLVREKKKKKKKKKNKKTNNAKFLSFRSSSIENTYYNRTWWYSSEEDEENYKREDETETLFSSKSLSSKSSDSRRGSRKNQVSRRRRADDRSCEVGLLPLEGKVKDSFAVVKKSSDPYNDFRTSMVEMIVEKQIFEAEDLEQLLQCFLSLNSFNHHRVIVEVFTEIWEALFSDWGS